LIIRHGSGWQMYLVVSGALFAAGIVNTLLINYVGWRKRPDMRISLWTCFTIPVRNHLTYESISLAFLANFFYFVPFFRIVSTLLINDVGWRKRPDMRVSVWTCFLIPVRNHETCKSTSLAFSFLHLFF
jgi:hypothetical protein